MVGYGHAHRSWQLIAVALNVIGERQVGIELRVKLLWLGSIENSRRLVGTSAGFWLVYVYGVCLYVLRQLVLLVGNDTVVKPYAWTECTTQNFYKQVDIVLLEVLIHKGAGYLYQQRLLVLVERLEDDGAKPCIVLLLSNVLTYERKGVNILRL